MSPAAGQNSASSDNRRLGARLLAVFVLVVSGALAGCSGGIWEGAQDDALCPKLPLTVVSEVAENLATEGTGPEGSPPESGTLPATGDDTGILYRCKWPSSDDDSASGLSVTVESAAEGDLVQLRSSLADREGEELSASAPGQGKAIIEDDTPRAVWTCQWRVLDVEIKSPAEGMDPLAAAKRLAEELIPQLGCTAA